MNETSCLSNFLISCWKVLGPTKKWIWRCAETDDFYNQMNPNTALPMEEVCGPQGGQCWKINLIPLEYLGQPMNSSVDPHTMKFEALLYRNLGKKWLIYCHPQTDCFVVSKLFCVARYVGHFSLRSKPGWLYANQISYYIAIDILSISKGIFAYI